MTPNTDEKTFIIWDKKFEIGIPVIDEQHRQLVLLTNDFYNELMNYKKMEIPKWEPQLIQALKKCTDYVLVHFNAEEKLMHIAIMNISWSIKKPTMNSRKKYWKLQKILIMQTLLQH